MRIVYPSMCVYTHSIVYVMSTPSEQTEILSQAAGPSAAGSESGTAAG